MQNNSKEVQMYSFMSFGDGREMVQIVNHGLHE